MNTTQDLAVTLSKSLYRHLMAEARRLDVSIELLVASMVCDTLEEIEAESVDMTSVAA